MRAITYTAAGDPGVLRLVDRPVPAPGPGEVRVRLHASGINPIDVKYRSGREPDGETVPHHDGAGIVDAVGPGAAADRVGQRVWVWGAAWQSREGTAQEFTVVPEERAVPLPDGAGFGLGAALGIPALTAHRALTVAETGPRRLAPGSLQGRTVLVTGGAGAVGHAAVQLASWAGAAVVATVSSPEKAALAAAAGARHVVDYRAEDVPARVREIAPEGVDAVVEVAVAANAPALEGVLAEGAAVAFYAAADTDEVRIPVRTAMLANQSWHGVFLYGIPDAALRDAVGAVSDATADGALTAGADTGLPLHRYPLEETADAHRAVEDGLVGKAVIDLVGAD
ncbi:NADPH:quinone reductase [Nocardiopsis chromatogenes]|uniref:NADPH:quinone reductase n=1 Tax=Nocardiopsis chromatogenes TaxID=280239 RepID=UPI00034BF5A6|nr:NADPH:quinone reductase [Nocardiopsis chromatogenes]